jgi:hypothetical protein
VFNAGNILIASGYCNNTGLFETFPNNKHQGMKPTISPPKSVKICRVGVRDYSLSLLNHKPFVTDFCGELNGTYSAGRSSAINNPGRDEMNRQKITRTHKSTTISGTPTPRG